MYASPEDILAPLRARDPSQPEFLQAAGEILLSLWPLLERNPAYLAQRLPERLLEAERVIQFRVAWTDDRGEVQVNRGFRVQMNSAIGPYKGGIRFHPTVNLSILKFLALEQTLKNSLTGLPMGGGKGGADFDPRGRSDGEIMRFCQAFMTELFRHIGADTDVPAGDIGVGMREVGYMYGMYRKLRNEVTGTFTGKGTSFGGSHVRPEATGYGLVFFTGNMLHTRDRKLAGLRVAVSGAGNVALHAALKAQDLGARVITLSDSGGTCHQPAGFGEDELRQLIDSRGARDFRLAEFARVRGYDYLAGTRPWQIPCDVALPCATQNELDGADARALLAGGCIGVAEGANMPCTPEAVQAFRAADILYAPGKAANAGGVAVSGLEMMQNATRQHWTEAEVETRLQAIMGGIHHACVHHGRDGDRIDYARGANIAGFLKVADAMIAQGVL